MPAPAPESDFDRRERLHIEGLMASLRERLTAGEQRPMEPAEFQRFEVLRAWVDEIDARRKANAKGTA